MHTTSVFALKNDGYEERDRVDRFLQRHVWARLTEIDRRFLEFAALLPEIDLDVLIDAGFPDARARWQRLRCEIPYLRVCCDGRFTMHEAFREFIRRTAAAGPGAAYRTLLVTIGRALERAGATVRRDECGAPEALTPAEVFVLRALAEGRSNRDIALANGRSENTVRVHVSAVLRKLGAKSRTEAVAIARRRAYVL